MENKPTLRERIATEMAKDCGFFDSRGFSYLSKSAQQVFGGKADRILNLLKEELDGLTVIGDEEIIIAVCGNCPFEGKFSDEDCHACQRQLKGIAQAQLSHTKEELKAKLGGKDE